MFLSIVLVGTITGVLAGLLGIGGGVILVPLLTTAFHIPIHHAIGVSLMTITATSSMAAAYHLKRDSIDIRLGIMLASPAVLGATTGGLLAGRFGQRALALLFAGLMVVMSLVMVRRLRRGEHSIVPVSSSAPTEAPDADETAGAHNAYQGRRLPAASGILLLAGHLSGLLGIGGGVIIVPTLRLLCRVPLRVAVATAHLILGVTASSAALVYQARGEIPPLLMAGTVLGALAGSPLGAHLTTRMRSRWIDGVFVALTFALAMRLIWYSR
ncbi:MAG: sulfite exporter TauE/SafE family protein [Acidobacteria bacterium]|nr:MAG: sulfite exporter TauE/SafE family protein [Acidobacteriota bacterium]